ncbi:BA14K family protein [Ochrobactrum sp. EDr1-4]|uniref:BA14K family protein n=1 Tax=Ochrobactrum sp. EDr1-4 TaxID=3368622 RepID=UPI003BA38735
MFKKSWILALSFAVAATSFTPAVASPLRQTSDLSLSESQIQQVQHRRYRDDRRGNWKRSNRDGWHNGHRGYRDQRRGYKRHSDGWWYPLAAFGAGAVLGGALNNQRPAARGYSNRHYQWCSSRYRTYRASDNTYVPSAGRRAICNSPYS